MTLLRDPTSSHLLETLVRRSPERVFDSLWRTYFVGKLARLAVHPVANFVVAKAFERVNAEQLDAAVQELQEVSGKIVSECSVYEKPPRLLRARPFPRECTNRCSTGIGRPLGYLARQRRGCYAGKSSITLYTALSDIGSQLITAAFDLDSEENKKMLVPCILRLKSLAVSVVILAPFG